MKEKLIQTFTVTKCWILLFLEKCKYVAKEKKRRLSLLLTTEIFSDDSDEENSNDEN